MQPVSTGRRTASQNAVRKISALVFSRAEHRVEIAAAIADSQLIANTAELAEQLGLSAQTVNHELGKLEAAGLLHRTERRERKVYLIGVPCGFWSLSQELRERAAELLDSVPRY